MQTSISFKITPNKNDFIKAMRAYSFKRASSQMQLSIVTILFSTLTVLLLLSRSRFGSLWLFVLLAKARGEIEKTSWFDRNVQKIVDFGILAIILVVIIVLAYLTKPHLLK